MPTKKGFAISNANIKSMTGVPPGIIAVLPVGGWVFGDESVPPTDILNVKEWYKPTGEKMPLSVSCKVSVVNLTVTDYTDPDVEPDPPPVGCENAHVEIDIVDGVVTVTVNNKVYIEQ